MMAGTSCIHTEAERRMEAILKKLSDVSVTRVVLEGESGVGKTWMARKVSESAVEKRLFDISLWVYLNRKYDQKSLSKSIAGQLTFLSTGRDIIDNDYDGDEDEEDNYNWENLRRIISKALEKKKFLLVLDDEGNKMDEDDIMEKLTSLLPLDQRDLYKVLITRVNNNDRSNQEETKINLMPLSVQESLFLLKERVDVYEMPEIKLLAEAFIHRSRRVPIEVITIAKVLSCLDKKVYAMDELNSALSEDAGNLNAILFTLLCRQHDLLPIDILDDFARLDSCFFNELGSIHYSELITYWMLEGYLGHVESVENTYQKGCNILLELIDCGLLKTIEANHVVVNTSYCEELRKQYVDNTAAILGLTMVSSRKWNGFGKIMLIDHWAEGLVSGKKFPNSISTVVIDGNRFEMEFLDKFLQMVPDIQALALFNPCFSSLPMSLTKMGKLKLLVLRGCDFLQNISHFLDIKYLTVLEISGPSALQVIPDDFFGHVRFLQNLTLSSLRILKLPSSLFYLTELVRVVVHRCSLLEILPSFRNARKLKVLDFSGCTSLMRCIDRSFNSNLELQTLDLSRTLIKFVPLLSRLKNLTSLLLRDCRLMDRLPTISQSTKLQVLDISGSGIKEFHVSSEARDLKMIDCSYSPIRKLPTNIGNVRSLYLRGCSRLQKLCLFESLTNLKELDLSSSTQLTYIENNFFTHLTGLRILNLSETNLKTLSLSPLANLCKLLLSNCLSLEKVGGLSGLTNLEVLDLSGCRSLTEIGNASFKQMHALQSLFLSDTNITYLPSLSNCRNLRHLVLANCAKLKVLPSLESLSKLEELNLSGIESLGDIGASVPSLSNHKNLKYLSFRDCRNLREVRGLEVLGKIEHLDLSGTAVKKLPRFPNLSNLRHLALKDCLKLKEFPYDISSLTHLEHLELPNMDIPGFDSENTQQPPEELNEQHSPAIAHENSSSNGSLLERDPSLWRTSSMSFHFLIHPVEAHSRCTETIVYKQELLVRDTNFQPLQTSYHHKGKPSLVIFGFYDFPRSVEAALCQAEVLFFIKNSFMRWLCDVGAENIKEIRACWIERCNYMEGVFRDDDMEHAATSVEDVKGKGKLDEVETTAKTGYDLEVLWISNVSKLKMVYWGNVRSNSFEKLNFLHLEHCPQLSSLCSSSFLLENLEVLRIKFCDGFKSLCESGSPTLPKLQILQLWELPKLESIECIAPRLHKLLVGGCHMLLNIVPSSYYPENLEVLEGKFCENLETVFENGGGSTYVNLRRLHLWDLPKLNNIGAELPALQDCIIRECSKLPMF